jgi:hypothetical protein
MAFTKLISFTITLREKTPITMIVQSSVAGTCQFFKMAKLQYGMKSVKHISHGMFTAAAFISNGGKLNI